MNCENINEWAKKKKIQRRKCRNKKQKCCEITFLDVFSFYRLLYFWKYRLFPLAVRDVKHYRLLAPDSDVRSMNVALYQYQIQYPAPMEIFSTMKFPERHQPAMIVSMMSNYRDARALYSFKWIFDFYFVGWVVSVCVCVVCVWCVFVCLYEWVGECRICLCMSMNFWFLLFLLCGKWRVDWNFDWIDSMFLFWIYLFIFSSLLFYSA